MIDSDFVLIKPVERFEGFRLGELWAYRDLLYFLVWRDIKVRYRQTVLGAAWAILQPFLTMVVFSLFLGKLAGVPSEGIPYPVFSFVALLPWSYFSSAVSQSTTSLVGQANLITKIYFPRLLVPLSQIVSSLVDFAIAFVVLIGMMIFYGIRPTGQIVWLPAFMLLALITALGVGLWLSAMNVTYRDVRYAVPFLIQLWLFATPVAYPSSLVPERWRILYGLNPMAGVVEGFRWALVGTSSPGPLLGASTIVAVLVLISGLVYFRRTEETFADIV